MLYLSWVRHWNPILDELSSNMSAEGARTLDNIRIGREIIPRPILFGGIGLEIKSQTQLHC